MNLPETGYLRLYQIIGDKKRGIPALIPISRSKWYAGIKEGIFPKPCKNLPGIALWEVEKIRELIESLKVTGEL